jgi:hypothetical protein
VTIAGGKGFSGFFGSPNNGGGIKTQKRTPKCLRIRTTGSLSVQQGMRTTA